MKKILIWFLSILISLPALSNVIYVKRDATGLNNGSSWVNAYTDLQSAINEAVVGDEIWVSSHVYKPTSTIDRSISFNLVDGVKMYGGFIGTESFVSERDLTNMSTLSGNIGYDSLRTDDSYHVVAANNINFPTLLDGFRICRGYANGTNTNRMGGGIYENNSSYSIVNCKLDSNYALLFGGAFYKLGAGVTIINSSEFIRNFCSQEGGAICIDSSEVILNHCKFNKNSAVNGGGIKIFDGTLLLDGCIFERNDGSGSSCINYMDAAVTSNNTVFKDNYGTCVSANFGGVGNFNDCKFMGNYAPDGSAITVNNYEYQKINRCIFYDNESDFGSMIEIKSSGKIRIENCLMVGNRSLQGRSCIHANGGTSTIIINCTMANNKSISNQACIRLSGGGLIANNLFQGNSPTGGSPIWATQSEAHNNLSDEPINSNFQTNNRIGTVQFISPGNWADAPFDLGSFNYRLKASSLGIDIGNDSLASGTDLDGNQRIYGDSVDLGAYENNYCITTPQVIRLCDENNITLTATGGNAYSWSNGSHSNSITVNEPGNYQVTVFDDDGNCIGEVSIPITSASFIVPVINIDASASILGTENYATYQWRLNGINILGATAQFYTPTENGVYSVLVTNDIGCDRLSSDYNFGNTTELNEAAIIEDIVIYPNPASDRLSYKISNPASVNMIEILDSQGRLLRQFYIENHITDIDVSILSKGIYTLKSTFFDNRVIVKRFVVAQ